MKEGYEKNEIMIYVGHIKVNLCPLEGKSIKFNEGMIKPIGEPREALKFLESMGKEHGPEYDNVYLPCIPHQLFDITENPGLIPGNLANPLIKCSLQCAEKILDKEIVIAPQDHIFEGFVSGRRSAILVDNGEYIRLKGCGNMLEGFGSMDTDFPQNGKEIRGCQYYNSALRELYYSHLITDLLKPYNLIAGNYPLGIWEYGPELKLMKEHKIVKLKNEYTKVGKYCALFKTYGEKRLGTHLVGGLSQILNSIGKYALTTDNQIISKLIDLFPEERKDPNNGLVLGTEKQISYTEAPKMEELDKLLCIEKINKLLEDGVMADICEYSKRIEDWTADLKIPLEFKEGESLIKEIIGCGNILMVILSIGQRIGFEVGRIKRIFEKHSINWGTFLDHNPFSPHCNCHPNNFIILPNIPTTNQLLAPLDFDMTFIKSGFVSPIQETPTFGLFDLELWLSWVNMERHEMEIALAGQENMANFSYKEGEGEISEEDLGGKLLGIMLTDIIVYEYRKTYLGEREEKDLLIPNVGENKEMHLIVQLALMITANAQT